MTKDEQIEYLVAALKAIRDDYYPYHGEDAVAIRDFASETINNINEYHKTGDK